MKPIIPNSLRAFVGRRPRGARIEGYTDWFTDMPLLILLILLVAPLSAGELFHDDFSRFPPGWLSVPVGMLNGAIQEYHYLPHRGVPTAPWFNAIGHLDSWIVGDEDGQALH